jgi:hypothetical protein
VRRERERERDLKRFLFERQMSNEKKTWRIKIIMRSINKIEKLGKDLYMKQVILCLLTRLTSFEPHDYPFFYSHES